MTEYQELPEIHYHVVAFINGCLNDTDSGPYADIESAREVLAELVADWHESAERINDDTYRAGLYTLTIEPCREAACDEELSL